MEMFYYNLFVLNNDKLKQANPSIDELNFAIDFLYVSIFEPYKLRRYKYRFCEKNIKLGSIVINVKGAEEYVSLYYVLKRFKNQII